MKRKMKISMLAIWAGIMTFGTSAALAQKKLSIGDMAPELRYSKWIKGEPNKLEGDQLYVLEFWATWCGPCKAAMPHLTELQKEFQGKATFIGVGVWEKVPAGQPYESSLPAVEKYVMGNTANMGYSVIADNNEQYMGNNWLKAAGENGIPSTFIVKNKQILWIGHPGSLDSIIPQMLSGKYDMQAFKAKFDKRADAGREQAAKMASIFKPIQDAMSAKDYKKVLQLIEETQQSQPQLKMPLNGMKFGVLLNNVDEKQGVAFAKKWQKEYPSAKSMILQEVYNKDGLSKETYIWAASNYGSTTDNTNPVIFDALASCYAKGGDFKSAVENQQKAVELGEKALKEGTMVGTIMDYTIKEYEEKLKQYQSNL